MHFGPGDRAAQLKLVTGSRHRFGGILAKSRKF
jgi:hypothetical protein